MRGNFNNIYDIDISYIRENYPNEDDRSAFFDDIVEYFKESNPKYTQNNGELDPAKYGQLINDLTDLDNEIKIREEDKLYLLRVLKDIGENHYWNESVDELIKDFSYYFYDNTIEEYENENGQDINSSQKRFNAGALKNADAGANFVKEKEIVEKYNEIFKVKFPWVIPWLNLNRKSYRTVRGGDKNTDVLSNEEGLQFTRKTDVTKKYQQWIRLLMPENLRRVEVEDLNRNFWVIGQVTSFLGNYFFGDDAIIPKTYNTILNEICQLWENIMYLWIAAAAQSKKKQYTDVHCEVIPINSNFLLNYLKYDNFNYQIDTNAENNETLKHLSYLVNTYTNSNLLILLENRVNNYEHNYFSEIQYLLLQYDRNRSMWFYDINKIGRVYLDNNGLNFYWGASEINHRIPANQLYSINTNEDNYYGLSMSKIGEISESSPRRFVTLIRPEYIISYEQRGLGALEPKIQINFYDVSRDLLGKNNQEQKYLASIFYNHWPILDAIDYNQDPFIIISDIEEAETEEIEVPIKRGYYQGELISKAKYPKIVWNTQIHTYHYTSSDITFESIMRDVVSNSIDEIYENLEVTNPIKDKNFKNYTARFDLIRYNIGDEGRTSAEMVPLAILSVKQDDKCEQHKLYFVREGKTIENATIYDIPFTSAGPKEFGGEVGYRCFLGPSYKDNILGKGEDGELHDIALQYSSYQVWGESTQTDGAAATTTHISNPILSIQSVPNGSVPYEVNPFYLYNTDRYTLLLEDKNITEDVISQEEHKRILRASVIWRKHCNVDLQTNYIYWADEIKRTGNQGKNIITISENDLNSRDWRRGDIFPGIDENSDIKYLDTCTDEMIQQAWEKINNRIIDF